MQKTSSGLLMYKFADNQPKVFLVHPGGPFWKNKDLGAWSVPKGEIENSLNETLLETAIRELKEETGIDVTKRDKGQFIELGSITQKSGKVVHCWAFEGDWLGLLTTSSYVTLEYPQNSKKFIKFPEVDKAAFFSIEEAKKRINSCQAELIDRLLKHLEKLKTNQIRSS